MLESGFQKSRTKRNCLETCGFGANNSMFPTIAKTSYKNLIYYAQKEDFCFWHR